MSVLQPVMSSAVIMLFLISKARIGHVFDTVLYCTVLWRASQPWAPNNRSTFKAKHLKYRSIYVHFTLTSEEKRVRLEYVSRLASTSENGFGSHFWSTEYACLFVSATNAHTHNIFSKRELFCSANLTTTL